MTYREALSDLDRVGDHWRRKYINRCFADGNRDRLKEHFEYTKDQAQLMAQGDISFIDAAHNVRCFPVK